MLNWFAGGGFCCSLALCLSDVYLNVNMPISKMQTVRKVLFWYRFIYFHWHIFAFLVRLWHDNYIYVNVIWFVYIVDVFLGMQWAGTVLVWVWSQWECRVWTYTVRGARGNCLFCCKFVCPSVWRKSFLDITLWKEQALRWSVVGQSSNDRDCLFVCAFLQVNTYILAIRK